MWQQADRNDMILQPLEEYGWTINTDGKLLYVWDSEENRRAVQERVESLLKGCKCKTGCTTTRCKCRKKNDICREGCLCIACENTSHIKTTTTDQSTVSDEILLSLQELQHFQTGQDTEIDNDDDTLIFENDFDSSNLRF
jgi:hypothetical protein